MTQVRKAIVCAAGIGSRMEGEYAMTPRKYGILYSIWKKLMPKYTFDQLKPRLTTAINQRIQTPGFPVDPRGYSLVDGFVNNLLQNDVGEGIGVSIGGKSIPTVMIVGNSTGLVFHFAVGVLLPDTFK